jgi:hypothetical protein
MGSLKKGKTLGNWMWHMKGICTRTDLVGFGDFFHLQ